MHRAKLDRAISSLRQRCPSCLAPTNVIDRRQLGYYLFIERGGITPCACKVSTLREVVLPEYRARTFRMDKHGFYVVMGHGDACIRELLTAFKDFQIRVPENMVMRAFDETRLLDIDPSSLDIIEQAIMKELQTKRLMRNGPTAGRPPSRVSIPKWDTSSVAADSAQSPSVTSTGKLVCHICKVSSPLDSIVPLKTCSTCSRKYHKACEQSSAIPQTGAWRCQRCIRKTVTQLDGSPVAQRSHQSSAKRDKTGSQPTGTKHTTTIPRHSPMKDLKRKTGQSTPAGSTSVRRRELLSRSEPRQSRFTSPELGTETSYSNEPSTQAVGAQPGPDRPMHRPGGAQQAVRKSPSTGDHDSGRYEKGTRRSRGDFAGEHLDHRLRSSDRASDTAKMHPGPLSYLEHTKGGSDPRMRKNADGAQEDTSKQHTSGLEKPVVDEKGTAAPRATAGIGQSADTQHTEQSIRAEIIQGEILEVEEDPGPSDTLRRRFMAPEGILLDEEEDFEDAKALEKVHAFRRAFEVAKAAQARERLEHAKALAGTSAFTETDPSETPATPKGAKTIVAPTKARSATKAIEEEDAAKAAEEKRAAEAVKEKDDAEESKALKLILEAQAAGDVDIVKTYRRILRTRKVYQEVSILNKTHPEAVKAAMAVMEQAEPIEKPNAIEDAEVMENNLEASENAGAIENSDDPGSTEQARAPRLQPIDRHDENMRDAGDMQIDPKTTKPNTAITGEQLSHETVDQRSNTAAAKYLESDSALSSVETPALDALDVPDSSEHDAALSSSENSTTMESSAAAIVTGDEFRKSLRPNYTYRQLVDMALMDTPGRALTQRSVRKWVENNMPGYLATDTDLEKGISNTLSFRVGRPEGDVMVRDRNEKPFLYVPRPGREAALWRWNPTTKAPELGSISDPSKTTTGKRKFASSRSIDTTKNARPRRSLNADVSTQREPDSSLSPSKSDSEQVESANDATYRHADHTGSIVDPQVPIVGTTDESSLSEVSTERWSSAKSRSKRWRLKVRRPIEAESPILEFSGVYVFHMVKPQRLVAIPVSKSKQNASVLPAAKASTSTSMQTRANSDSKTSETSHNCSMGPIRTIASSEGRRASAQTAEVLELSAIHVLHHREPTQDDAPAAHTEVLDSQMEIDETGTVLDASQQPTPPASVGARTDVGDDESSLNHEESLRRRDARVLAELMDWQQNGFTATTHEDARQKPSRNVPLSEIKARPTRKQHIRMPRYISRLGTNTAAERYRIMVQGLKHPLEQSATSDRQDSPRKAAAAPEASGLYAAADVDFDRTEPREYPDIWSLVEWPRTGGVVSIISDGQLAFTEGGKNARGRAQRAKRVFRFGMAAKGRV